MAEEKGNALMVSPSIVRRLPQYVHVKVSRHGKTCYYFWRDRNARRVRLPDDPKSQAFKDAYFAAANSSAPTPKAKKPEKYRPDMQRIESALKASLKGARERAAARGREYSINLDWALSEVERNNFKCPLTGITFFMDAEKTASGRHPFAPSLDRIDNAKGYTPDNVRIVVLAANTMIADWGEAIFRRVANGYRHTTGTPSALPLKKYALP